MGSCEPSTSRICWLSTAASSTNTNSARRRPHRRRCSSRPSGRRSKSCSTRRGSAIRSKSNRSRHNRASKRSGLSNSGSISGLIWFTERRSCHHNPLGRGGRRRNPPPVTAMSVPSARLSVGTVYRFNVSKIALKARRGMNVTALRTHSYRVSPFKAIHPSETFS
jgi:hypothetical protein